MTTKPNTLKKSAAKMADELILIAMRKRKWTAEEGARWNRALTALRKLGGYTR